MQTIEIQHAGLSSMSNTCICGSMIYVLIVLIEHIFHIPPQKDSRASLKFGGSQKWIGEVHKKFTQEYIYHAATCTSV
jgi:hypothetical protein